MKRSWKDVVWCGCLALCLAPLTQAQPALARFRITDMDLRDPHLHVNAFGTCVDFTDTPLFGYSVNGELQTSLQTDDDGDGLLDLSILLEFLPLDQSQSSNLFDSGRADCAAPSSSPSCAAITTPFLSGDASMATVGSCLAPLPGTVRPYVPAVTSPGAACFASPSGTLTISLGGIPIPLHDAQLAAHFDADPAQALSEGLLRGFVSEADANATLIPASVPLIGGQPLSSLLPGGAGSCAPHSDKDLRDNVSGWWFYFNYSAARIASEDLFGQGFADGFEQ